MATKIIIITDAWEPQVNGVVTTYKNIIKNIDPQYQIEIIHPGLFSNFTLPFYKDIQIGFCSRTKMTKILLDKSLDNVNVKYHIATEGPLGLTARNVLNKAGIQYTSAYHTKFPEFIKAMYGIPVCFTKWYFDWFHKNSKYVMCSSISNAKENSFWSTVVLGKGYDTHFNFNERLNTKTKTLLYVGRVSKEKNIEDFCKLPDQNYRYTYRKIVVGDGPDKKRLEKKYPHVCFVGYKFGEELAWYYKHADVFVFPSKADTYGIVILESMACGTPVAAYPVTGPMDQIIEGVNGSMSHHLHIAVQQCCLLDRKVVHKSVQNISWKKSAADFINFVEK